MRNGLFRFYFLHIDVALTDLPYLILHQGVKAVIAKSFERIHRSNLVGMGIIPLCFKAGEDADSLGLTGHERYSIDLPDNISEIRPGQDVSITTDSGKSFTCTVRFDTEVIPHSFPFTSLSSKCKIFVFPARNISNWLLITNPLQVELAYFNHGGILPYVIRNLIKQ